MTDDRLRNHVLKRADQDASLSEEARLVVLAAMGDPGDLSEVLGDDATSPALVQTLTAVDLDEAEPVGAYLRSIAVRGFRGVGPKVTVELQPGPGLTVVAGRNGSGKSTLAEALELALTGTNSRWTNKAEVWSRTWRNLHAPEPAEVRVQLAEEGSGTTTLGVDWASGEDDVDGCSLWVQRKGAKREDVAVLGWAAALEMYRPLLSYDELGGILEGRPSEFYDQLYKLLGLEQLAAAMDRLDGEVKQLKTPGAEARKARDALRPALETHDDPRAATALAQLKKTKPNLDAVRPLITEGAAATVPAAWRSAERLVAPGVDEVAGKCAALRSAASAEQQEARRSDELAADRARLIEDALSFHERHGEQPCPVCGQGRLTDDWATAALAALEQEQSAAQALTAARAQVRQVRSSLLGLVRTVDAPPLNDAELTTLAAARTAFDGFMKPVAGDDAALADHLEQTLPALREAYAALREEAAALIQSRQDAWSPVALDLAEWVARAQVAADAEPKLKVAVEAQKWLQDNAAELRNERIAPLADEARRIWATLRQESNVELGAIRLEGKKMNRRVVLEAAVDGAGGATGESSGASGATGEKTEAFGVMSQGELQALALAIFIPRATSRDSPFRFLVLDDPIQAMDPSKIDGFLDVLTALAAHRQVVVFTHDDRLPAAIRRSQAPARILEVSRSANSAVTVTESTRPAKRMLDDAYAIAADEAVPAAVKNAAIPMLCREALEATAWDVYSAKALTAGSSRTDVEDAWEEAQGVKKRIALALDGDGAFAKWTSGGPWRKAAMKVATAGIHGTAGDYKAVVNEVRRATRDLQS